MQWKICGCCADIRSASFNLPDGSQAHVQQHDADIAVAYRTVGERLVGAPVRFDYFDRITERFIIDLLHPR
jgi:hypothetical protein